ncbi:hypothetical protein LZ30DRAFT_790500 [Colletotrichum cereale]|nr:hypothetical protein LZ30DRAFT_790500 [Colletotrichum cereale]
MRFTTAILLFVAATTTSALKATKVTRDAANPVLAAKQVCCSFGPIGLCSCFASSVECHKLEHPAGHMRIGRIHKKTVLELIVRDKAIIIYPLIIKLPSYYYFSFLLYPFIKLNVFYYYKT